MSILLFLLWIVGIGVITLSGSFYVRRYGRADALIGLYVAVVTISNIIASKITIYDFGFASFTADAASLIFPVVFLLTDIVNEKFGKAEAHRMVFVAFLTQVVVSFFMWIAVKSPAAPFWTDEASFNLIFGQVPRIILASWVAFLVSNNLDVYIFSWFKKITKGRHLWARNVLSSVPAMALDSVLFATLAFYGSFPLMPVIIGITATKWLVGIIDIPFMYLNRFVMEDKSLS